MERHNFIVDCEFNANCNIFSLMCTYKLHLHPEPEGGFTVSVPALPGCITYGEDVEEAIAMAKEAIELYIEELEERGEVVRA